MTADTGPILTAAWLGLLAAASPCPLAANLATVAYLGRLVDSPARAITHGLLYAAGRATAYVLIGAAVLSGAAAAPGLSRLLQRYGDPVVGGVLVLTGAWLLLAGRLAGGGSAGERARWLADRGGAPGAFALGAVFALAFCPVSAGLFFGALLPLAARAGEPVLLPLSFGLATGLPVAAFAVALAYGTAAAARLFRATARLERAARPATAAALMGLGAWLLAGRPLL